MSETAIVKASIEPQLKASVEDIFDKLGLTSTEAITLFYQQVKLNNGLPFSCEIPNELTEETFQKTDRGEELISCETPEDMFEKLSI